MGSKKINGKDDRIKNILINTTNNRGLKALLGDKAYEAARKQTSKKLAPKEALIGGKRPIVPWDADKDFFHMEIIWFMKLDNRFMVEVRLIKNRPLHLSKQICIFDHDNNDKLIHTIAIGLDYLSDIKPNKDDIESWQYAAANYVDRHVLKRFKNT